LFKSTCINSGKIANIYFELEYIIMNNKIIALSVSILTPLSGSLAFSDVMRNQEIYLPISYLSNQNVINGYSDGTFGPQKILNRAAALKIILIAAEKKLSTEFSGKFSDVPNGAWFTQYVETAANLKIVSGDAKTGLFTPGRTVNRAEFLKMLFSAFEVDISTFDLSAIKLADAPDGAWFTPYIKFAIKFGILLPDANGNVKPSDPLTRKEAADLIFKTLEKGKGLSYQALLNLTETHLIEALTAIEESKLSKAGIDVVAAERFVLLVTAALPKNNIAQSAGDITESIKSLVGAYAAGQNGQPEEVITSAKKAWQLADVAFQKNPAQSKIVEEIKNLAADLAGRARKEIKNRDKILAEKKQVKTTEGLETSTPQVTTQPVEQAPAATTPAQVPTQ